MILTFAGERASRTQENQMLQSFLEALEARWLQSADWIFVVAFSMWEGAEVDLVCILPTAIVVADFKNFRGRLTGTENGPWLSDGVTVKGGAKTNPYVQLRDNRISVRNWLSRKGLLAGRNLGHLAAGVVFSGPITDHLDISPKSRTWFHVTDLGRCAVTLDSIASPELTIREDEAADIVRQLGVGALTWKSSRPAVLPVPGEHQTARSRPPLTEHQAEGLRTIDTFLTTRDLTSLAVRGMTSTGKTRVLAEAIDAVVRQGRVAIPLAPNRRLATKANRSLDIDCDSIYQHLYDVSRSEDTKTDKDAGAVRIVPMRSIADPADCVYLIDDAHLLGNAEFRTTDGKKFGTGRLLNDLFEFTKIGQNQRQVVFFGDPYQIPRASPSESILDGSFQSMRGAKHQSIELVQLIDASSGKAMLRNALRLVEGIRAGQFSSIDLTEDDTVRIVDRQKAAVELIEQFRASPIDTWYLAETHGKVNDFTRWLRTRLLGRAVLVPVEVGDLIEIYTAPHPQDGGLSESTSTVEPGQRLQVEEVWSTETHQQSLIGRLQPIQFRSTRCRLAGEGAGTVDLLEDFLLTERPELEVDTLIALDVWQKSNGHLGFACGRYGYGSTVHHAQGLKRNVCFANAEHSAGRHTEGYFRWLYTAITIAKRVLVLFNYEPIHPLDTATWNLGSVKVNSDINIGAGWHFEPEAPVTNYDQQRPVPEGLADSKNLKISVAIWLRVNSALERTGWTVGKVSSHPFQERIELTSPVGDKATMKVAYNGKNFVTALHVFEEVHWPILVEAAATCIAQSTYSRPARALLDTLGTTVSREGWRVVSALESDFRLIVGIVREPQERVSLEMNFDKQGLVSSVRPLQCSCPSAIDEVRRLLR